MKKTTSLLVLLVLLAVGNAAFSQKQKPKPNMLRHVVMFKFKDSATPEQVKEVEAAFRKLPTQIKEIAGYEWGTNNSPENLNQGFTHCFFLSFKSEADRAVYLPHPDHKAFGKVLGPYLDKVLVLDYFTEN